MTTIVVSGALANKPNLGGEAWVRLNWLLGLKRLGCNVYFVEQIGRDNCVDAAGATIPFEQSLNKAYFDEVCAQHGLTGSAALIYEHGEQSAGLSLPDLFEIAESAALLVNISGHLTWAPCLKRIRRKAYIDIDPGFTQFWHVSGNRGARLAGHDHYWTIGENIGRPDCSIPTGGIAWRPTRQPVVLDSWPVAQECAGKQFTTIANWRGPYGPVEFDGKTFGLKVHEFRKFIELPRRSRQEFEIALNIHPAEQKDLQALRDHGWRIVDPSEVARTPEQFRRYVQGSAAEFSAAQGIYVDTNSGWFSDRTVRYLASGKPALVQDTGFASHLPVGAGLLAFRTLEEAMAGAEQIMRDYDHHCSAARALAETYFDSDKVLGRLLDEAGLTP